MHAIMENGASSVSDDEGSADEPLFTAVPQDDPDLLAACDCAYETIPQFVALLQVRRADAFYSAKLRFRDPDESDRLGEDRFVFLWLTEVYHYPEENCFSGVFFEVPVELQAWFQVGQHHVFGDDSVFDWMVLEDGRLQGGFTLRVMREKLSSSEREAYDRYIGVSVYEPCPPAGA